MCIGLEASLAGNPRVLILAAREMEREVSLNRGVVDPFTASAQRVIVPHTHICALSHMHTHTTASSG